MRFDLLHPADQLVMIMERIYAYGMTTTSGGNLSIRDTDESIWITPGSVDKGALTRRDIIRVRADGSIEGPHKPSSEFPFHKKIYERRPDLKAVLHAHPPALVAFSIVRKIPQLHLIPNVAEVCGEVAYATYALPGSDVLGDTIAGVFERGIQTVLLENHGIVVGSENLFQAFMAFETLDFTARLELKAYQLGTPRPLTNEQITLTKRKVQPTLGHFVPGPVSSQEREMRREMCQLIHRAYDQQLISSTQGTFSCRLDESAFLITPYGVDRKYLEPQDLVRIEEGCSEAGKIPSRSVYLHRKVYELHPEVRAMIIAHPPSAMVFSVTDEPFDSRTIPESYILLRSLPKLPYGSNFTDLEATAKTFCGKVPVILVENDSVMVVGNSLLQAFDRLEVAEYSAKALIDAQGLGPIVAIGDKEIDELLTAFKLEK